MIAYVIYAVVAIVLTVLWRRAARSRDQWMLEANAKTGRIRHLMGQLTTVEVPLKARIAELMRSNHKTLMDLGTALIERDDARGEALMWKTFAQAKVGIEDAEASVGFVTAILTAELAEVSA